MTKMKNFAFIKLASSGKGTCPAKIICNVVCCKEGKSTAHNHRLRCTGKFQKFQIIAINLARMFPWSWISWIQNFSDIQVSFCVLHFVSILHANISAWKKLQSFVSIIMLLHPVSGLDYCFALPPLIENNVKTVIYNVIFKVLILSSLWC